MTAKERGTQAANKLNPGKEDDLFYTVTKNYTINGGLSKFVCNFTTKCKQYPCFSSHSVNGKHVAIHKYRLRDEISNIRSTINEEQYDVVSI